MTDALSGARLCARSSHHLDRIGVNSISWIDGPQPNFVPALRSSGLFGERLLVPAIFWRTVFARRRSIIDDIEEVAGRLLFAK